MLARKQVSGSGLSKVGKSLFRPRVPEDLFANRPELANTERSAVLYTCTVCGVIEPRAVEIGSTQRVGFLRMNCACERRSQEEQNMRSFAQNQAVANSRKAGSVCYSWLGKGNEQKRLESQTFEAFDPSRQPEAYREMINYASSLANGQHDKPNALLLGTNGTGKTHLATASLSLLRERDIPCLFATAPHLMDAFYATAFEFRPQLLTKIVQTRVLVIDELDKLYVKQTTVEEGQEPGSFQRGILGEIINGRYNKGLPTIITTNEMGSLKRWLDNAARSRLGGCMITHVMNGDDYRRRARREE